MFFLSNPYFVIPWYTIGIIFAIWILYDMVTANNPINNPLKPGWFIITIFFLSFHSGFTLRAAGHQILRKKKD